MNKKETPNEKTNKFENEIIALIDIYFNEFVHRSEMLWSRTTRFFYATIMVMLLPYIAKGL